MPVGPAPQERCSGRPAQGAGTAELLPYSPVTTRHCARHPAEDLQTAHPAGLPAVSGCINGQTREQTVCVPHKCPGTNPETQGLPQAPGEGEDSGPHHWPALGTRW